MSGKPMTHFCCGLTLRAGAVFTSILCGLTALISMIVWIVLLSTDLEGKYNKPESYDDINYHHGADFKSFHPVMLSLLIVLTIISAGQVIVNIVLFIGTIKNIGHFVHAWVLFYFLFIFLNLVSNIFITILAYNINSNGVGNTVALVARAIFELVVTVYLMTVVHGHYVTMDRGEPKDLHRPWRIEPI